MQNDLILPEPMPGEPDVIRIGDHGFVRLHRTDGTDADVVKAARVSYSGGTKTVREDAGLINYLARNAHSSPFEQVSQTFHICAELFTRSQMVRTRTANWNETSARYSEMSDRFYLPEALRNQSKLNKQQSAAGSFESLNGETEADLIDQIDKNNTACFRLYVELLAAGVSREQARMVLPQTLMTEWYFRLDANNFMKTMKLRSDGHAQPEIQKYALAMLYFFRRDFPMLYDAWLENFYHARTFSGKAVDFIRHELGTNIDSDALKHGLESRFSGDELQALKKALL